MEKPNNITYDDLIKSNIMFWNDRNLEQSINQEIEDLVDALESKLKSINTISGLKAYIKSDEDSLTNILTLMDIREEKFKRVISLVRKDRKFSFSTEWSLKKTRSVLIENESFMDEVCELLINGSESERFKRRIPDFYRESFRIDKTTMSRLRNHNELRNIAKRQLEVKYNNGVANAVNKKIEETIKLTCDLEGLKYGKNKSLDWNDKVFHFIVYNEDKPLVLIDCSYNITTSSKQTNNAKNLALFKKALRERNDSIIVVNVLEGAGWVARQSDLREIYRNSDYTLNMTNIGLLDRIIRYALEESENEC